MKYLALVVVAFAMVIALVGCGLTPEQSAALQAYELQLDELHREGGEFFEELSYYDVEIAAVASKVRDKKIPYAEGMALISQFMERKTETLKAYSEIRAQIDATWQAKVDLEAKEVPWWAVALTTVTTILGALGLKKWQTAANVAKAVVCGVETGGDKNTKVAIEQAAIGAGVAVELRKIVNANTPTKSVVINTPGD